MVEEDFAIVASVREVILKVDSAAQRNVAAELVPLGQTYRHGLLEHLCKAKTCQRQCVLLMGKACLDEGQHLLDVSPRVIERSFLLVHFDGHLLDRCALPANT